MGRLSKSSFVLGLMVSGKEPSAMAAFASDKLFRIAQGVADTFDRFKVFDK